MMYYPHGILFHILNETVIYFIFHTDFYSEEAFVNIILSDDRDKIFLNDNILRDSLIITGSEKIFKELQPDLNIILINSTHSAHVSRDDAMQICDKVNSFITEVLSDTTLQMIWETAFNYPDGIGNIGIELLGICKKCDDIFITNNIEKVFIIPGDHNRMLCQVIIEISKKYGIPCKFYPKSLKFLYDNCFLLRKLFYALVNSKLFFTLLQIPKRRKKEKHTFGYSVCSNARRIINWTSEAAEKFKDTFPDYRILCMDCKETAEELKDRGFRVDIMEEWFSFNIFMQKMLEYIKLRKKIYNMFRMRFEYSFDDINLTCILMRNIERYLFQEVALYYRWNIICASYFRDNVFDYIEPYCVSSYPQTRIFYVNVKEGTTKMCRTDNADLYFGPYDTYYEKYPNVFSVRFTSDLGVDYMKELRNLGWNGLCYNIGGGGYQDKWENACSRDKNAGKCKNKLRTVLLAPTGPINGILTTQEISIKIDNLLDGIRRLDFNIICKFHPNMLLDNEIICLINKYKEYKNIYFPESHDEIEPYLEQADLIVTDVSLVIFDTISDRKPLILYCPGDEYNLVSYMNKYIYILRNADEAKTLLAYLLQNNVYYNKWVNEIIRKQDGLLNKKSEVCKEPYKKIKELIDKYKYFE